MKDEKRRVDQRVILRLGDCVEVLIGLDVGPKVAIICDPPYG